MKESIIPTYVPKVMEKVENDGDCMVGLSGEMKIQRRDCTIPSSCNP